MNMLYILHSVSISFLLFYLILYFKLKKQKQAFTEELNNLANLLTIKNDILTKELTQYIKWINEDFPEELVTIFFTDVNVIELKQNSSYREEDFAMLFKQVLIKIQNKLISRSQVSLDNISTSLHNITKQRVYGKNIT